MKDKRVVRGAKHSHDNKHDKKPSVEEKRKKQEDEEFVLDIFDFDRPIDIATDRCAFCKQDHDYGKLLKSKCISPEDDAGDEEERSVLQASSPKSTIDVEGIWASRYALNYKSRMFAHYYCALNSPKAWLKENYQWFNLGKEIGRGRQLKCHKCNKGGATVGCHENRCPVVYHVPCAIIMGFRFNLRGNVGFRCPDHDPANIRNMRVVNPVRQVDDFSMGREPIPIPVAVNTSTSNSSKSPVSDERGSSSLFPNFWYTPGPVDSDEVRQDARNVDLSACCSCDGLCCDVTVCECIAGGRNYSFTGQLIPGVANRIVECNYKCNCNARRCTNRVASNGPSYQLQVFEIPHGTASNSSSSHSRSSGGTGGSVSPVKPSRPVGSGPISPVPRAARQWGVRCLEDIPSGAFVCVVAGQLVAADSVVPQQLSDTSIPLEARSTKTVLDYMLESRPATVGVGASGHNNSSNKVVPLGCWEDEQFYSPAEWAARRAREREAAAVKEEESVSGVHSGTGGESIESDGGGVAMVVDDSDQSAAVAVAALPTVVDLSASSSRNSSGGAESSVVSGPPSSLAAVPATSDRSTTSSEQPIAAGVSSAAGHNTTALSLCAGEKEKEEGDPVRAFLKGEICLDSRYFGNVGSFIRRRPRSQRPGGGMASSSVGSTGASSSNSTTISSSTVDGDRMLLRRFIYTNANGNERFPRLALFAARHIPAGTELLI